MEEIINNDNTEVKKEKTLEEIKKKMNDLLDLSEIEELIKSNEKIVEIDGVTYKVGRPTFRQKQEVYKKRIEKFTELLQNDKYILEADLKASYLKRNINIDEMTNKIMNLIKRRDDLMLKLGEAIKNGAPDPDLTQYENQIKELSQEISLDTMKKTILLEFCIENQVLIYIYSYLTFILAEKKEGENWVKVWNTWEDFQNDNSNLGNKLSYYVTMLNSLESL